MSFTPLYNEYTPTKIVIDNLGINISTEKNDSLSLSSEYLVVGERSDKTISMVIDNRGFCVNKQSTNSRFHDNEIHGNTLLKGNVYVEGTIFGNIGCNQNSTISIGNIFNYSYNGEGIYYDGRATFGSSNSASNNLYVVNISKEIQRNIDNAQFAIQNNHKSVAKMAILGQSEFSPVIFNTSSNVPIEFHVGRDQNYFNNIYTKTAFTPRPQTVTSELPRYLNKSSSPHLNIDINGNVGIKTDLNQLFRYNIRTLDENGGVQFENQIFRPDLFVNGTTFSSNILMFDYETDTHKNLDEIYARRTGQSIVLSNLAPGKFAKGFFEFQSNVSIMGNIDPSSSLIVYGDTSNTGNLYVNGNLNSEKTLTTRGLHVEERATFSNNLYIQDNIFIKANIYKYVETLNNEDIYEILQISDENVLNIQNGVTSDFFYYGSGYATKGRFGIGIDQTRRDQVNNQLVVTKRDQTIFELELTDNNYLGFIKTAFIGHANTNYENRTEGSLVFVTPGPNNPVYHASQTNAKQNIYFYPGHEGSMTTFNINSNVTPTLGLFVNKRVGIKTFDPKYDFDVNGDVAITGNYYVKGEDNSTDIKLGIWSDRSFGTDKQYSGIFYYNEKSPHVGINTIPSQEYGLTVVGKILSYDGFYTTDGLKTIPFYNAYEASLKNEQEYEYAYLHGRLGIGDFDTLGTLSVRDSFPGENTSIKLLNSAFGQTSTLHFVGNQNEYIQMADDTDGTFELFNSSSNTIYDKNFSRAFITKKYPNGENQIIINSNISYGNLKQDAALVVNGNVDINGDVNITGNYKISSRAIQITAGEETAEFYKTPDISDSVYITGDNIHLNTNSFNNGALYIGWRNRITNSQQNALVNVCLNTLGNAPKLIFVTKLTSLNSTTSLSQYACSSDFTSVIGILNSRFYIGKDITTPYITVNPQVNNSIGLGTANPNGSRLHVYSAVNQQTLATFTRFNNSSDANAIFADVCFEKRIQDERYQWNIHAPVLSGNMQKLQFLYTDTVNTGYDTLTEKMCITKEGFIGINNPEPKYALDINGHGLYGSIRMHQSSLKETRQNLVFQSGNDTYGGDLLTDYSIYTFSNTFCIEASDVMNGSLPIFHIGSNNTIGLNRCADDNYSVSIDGTLNVSETISINGRPFFSVLDNNNENGSFLEWKNIFINPEPFTYGGVTINGVKSSSNVFQINSGMDGNMIVLNSAHPQSLMHFRNLHLSPGLQENERIWRTGSSNNSFILEYRSNVIFDETLITDSLQNYVRIAEYIETDISGEFIEHLNGSIELAALNPSITMNNQNKIGLSNESIYIITSNLGIGLTVPVAKIDIENNNDVDSFKIIHNNTTCNIVTINRDNFVIAHNGYVGIGTYSPETTMHVIGTTKFENTGNNLSIEVVGNSIFQNNITIKGNVVNDSDSRIKSDVKVIENALSKIKKISGYTFIKNDKMPRETGVIAQEIREVLPEAVFEHNDGLLGVAYGNMIGLLIEGIKELSDKLDDIYLRIYR